MNNFPIFKRIAIYVQVFLAIIVCSNIARAAGEVDPTFDAAVQEPALGRVETVVIQPDGKILVGGNFSVANNTARSNIARFNTDGTVDQTFNPPDLYKVTPQSYFSLNIAYVYSIAVQTDGKILVAGDFYRVGVNTVRQSILRLNADGSLDTTFVPPPLEINMSSNISAIREVKVQSNNQILIGGNFILAAPVNIRGLARLNADGSPDTSFNPNVTTPGAVNTFVIQPDGKIIYPRSPGIVRINPDGSLDNSFTPVTVGFGTFIDDIVLQADGKAIVAGIFTALNGFPQNNIAPLNTDGTLDASFNTNGVGSTQAIKSVSLLPDGKIFIGGTFTSYNNVQRLKNARLNSDGTLDTTFNYSLGSDYIVNDVKPSGDGKVIIGGYEPNAVTPKLFRVNADGTLDSSFAARIYQKENVLAVQSQTDGKVLVGGVYQRINGVTRLNFARLNQDGSVDTGFVANTNGPVITTAIQADGKILIGGNFNTVNGIQRGGLFRLNTDGSVDTSFTPTVGASKIVVLPDGKILVANGTVTRLNTNGSIDSTFNSPTYAYVGNAAISNLRVQTDGKIVVAGGFTQINNIPRGRIARLNADGTLDNSFNPPFGANDYISDLTIQSNGGIVIGGDFTGVNGVTNRRYVARLNSDGSLDTNFNPTADFPVYAVAKQSDDKILIGGTFGILYGNAPYNFARLNQNGSFDATFNGPGANDYVRTIFVQADDKIIIGGDFSRVNNISRVGVARLLNSAASARTRYDYDGDGRADITVFRPANGFWYSLGSQSGAFSARQFGQAGDQIVPADYDGDGKTDLAVFRAAANGPGYFYIMNSGNGAFRPVQFGQAGDLPVVGDWDGDGVSDLAVYRDGSITGGASVFYYRPSSAAGVSFRQIIWGAAGDRPLLGDFDGDGKLDAAVFRPSNAYWYISMSANSQYVGVPFGRATDILTPADFNGDGKTDFGVFRPENGTWYYSSSLTSPGTQFTTVPFGQSGDVPVAADYDGDGKADIAVFRPSNGSWYLNRSTQGFTGVQFGQAGDQPAPNAYNR